MNDQDVKSSRNRIRAIGNYAVLWCIHIVLIFILFMVKSADLAIFFIYSLMAGNYFLMVYENALANGEDREEAITGASGGFALLVFILSLIYEPLTWLYTGKWSSLSQMSIMDLLHRQFPEFAMRLSAPAHEWVGVHKIILSLLGIHIIFILPFVLLFASYLFVYWCYGLYVLIYEKCADKIGSLLNRKKSTT